ncbi:NACHT%2C LRR and PYD domains-containing protein 12-like, partial [Scomber scombrus]
MALLKGRRRGALRVKLSLCLSLVILCHTTVTVWSANGIYDRATLLRLRECSLFGHLDPSTLNPYPELTRYGDSTLGRHTDNNRPWRRRGRGGGSERRLRRL